MEAILGKVADLREGRVSTIELVDKLSMKEKEYPDALKKDGCLNVSDIKKLHSVSGRSGDKVSEEFCSIFKKQMGDDRMELEKAEMAVEKDCGSHCNDRNFRLMALVLESQLAVYTIS